MHVAMTLITQASPSAPPLGAGDAPPAVPTDDGSSPGLSQLELGGLPVAGHLDPPLPPSTHLQVSAPP